MPDLNLYKNFSVPNVLDKNITLVATHPGTQLVDPTGDYEITVRFIAGDVTWDHVNYFSWDNAYYFLEDVDHTPEGSLVHGRMDLLMTYQDAIRQLSVFAERSTSHGSPRADDAMRLYSVDSQRTDIDWPYPIFDQEMDGAYILTTSQSGYGVA